MPEINENVTVSRGNPFNSWANSQVGSGILGGLFGIGNNVLSYFLNRRAAREQNKMALDWWNMQNEYNSPKSQIKRLVEAGLNPNLMYGQMSSSNAGDVGTPAVASANFNMNPAESITAGLTSAMQLYGMAEDLRRKKMDNDWQFDLYTAVPDQFNWRSDWFKTKNWLDLQNKYNKAFGGQLENDYNMRSMQDRLDLLKFRRKLTAGQAGFYDLQNSWYEANQIFNMVNQGINTIFSNFVVPFLPKKIYKIFQRIY